MSQHDEREADIQYETERCEEHRLDYKALPKNSTSRLTDMLMRELSHLSELEKRLERFHGDVEDAKSLGASDRQIWGDPHNHVSFPEAIHMEMAVIQENVDAVMEELAKRNEPTALAYKRVKDRLK